MSVTVPLTGESVFDDYIRWSDNYSLGSLFDANGEEQVLSLVDLNNANPPGLVRISITGTNNRFTPEFEATGRFTFTASDGESVTVVLANADMTEIYQWTPTNSAEVVAFVLHVKGLTDQTGTITLTGEGTATTTDHAVNAGNVAWVFDLPEPTVTHIPATPVPTDHAVNAGNVAWSFDLPQPSVTHTTVLPQDHTVNAGDVSWSFSIPQPTVTHTPATPATVPDQPTGLAATATHDTVSLTWGDPSDSSITSYQILRRDVTGGVAFAIHIDIVPVGTSYDDTTDVDPENAYRYRIKARNAQGVGPQSASVSVTTQAVPGAVPLFVDDTGVSQVWAPNTIISSVTVPTASGTPTPTYAVVGNPPAGISFSTSTRIISGTPRWSAQGQSASELPTLRGPTTGRLHIR